MEILKKFMIMSKTMNNADCILLSGNVSHRTLLSGWGGWIE